MNVATGTSLLASPSALQSYDELADEDLTYSVGPVVRSCRQALSHDEPRMLKKKRKGAVSILFQDICIANLWS